MRVWMFAAILIVCGTTTTLTSYGKEDEVTQVKADDDARDHADLAEGARREAKWREAGYHIISMKNDFLTIYGPEVEKVDFTFPAE